MRAHDPVRNRRKLECVDANSPDRGQVLHLAASITVADPAARRAYPRGKLLEHFEDVLPVPYLQALSAKHAVRPFAYAARRFFVAGLLVALVAHRPVDVSNLGNAHIRVALLAGAKVLQVLFRVPLFIVLPLLPDLGFDGRKHL